MPNPISRRAFLYSASAAVVAPGLLSACETTPPAPPATGFPAIVDTATRLDEAKANGLRALGAKTVFRYYCHLPPSLPNKDLTPEEARIIQDAGLSLATVFQHYNNCFRTFENNWGTEDAAQALRQAEAAGQPEGSAIYFGVDGDWPYAEMVDPVVAYFEAVANAFNGSGIAVGVYSNGCLTNAVLERGLADYAWLSGSTAHTGTQAFYNTGRWTLFQNALDVRVNDGAAAIAIDTNLASPASGGYFGQWDARGARTAAQSDGETRGILGARRFLTTETDVKEAADGFSGTRATVRKNQNVRVLGVQGSYTRVLTQEGGSRPSSPSVEGFVPTASLKDMTGFPDGTTAYGICGSDGSFPDARKYEGCSAAANAARGR